MSTEIKAQENCTYIGIEKARVQAREMSKTFVVRGSGDHRAQQIVVKYGVRVKVEKAYYAP